MGTCELAGGTAAARTGAGHHDPGHAVAARAFEHRVEVGAKRFVGQVGADVDQLHARALHCFGETRDYAGIVVPFELVTETGTLAFF